MLSGGPGRRNAGGGVPGHGTGTGIASQIFKTIRLCFMLPEKARLVPKCATTLHGRGVPEQLAALAEHVRWQKKGSAPNRSESAPHPSPPAPAEHATRPLCGPWLLAEVERAAKAAQKSQAAVRVAGEGAAQAAYCVYGFLATVCDGMGARRRSGAQHWEDILK